MTKYILIGIGIYLAIQIAYRLSKKFSIVKSRWMYMFDGLKFSTEDFYTSVQELIQSKEMSRVAIEKVKFDQTNIYASDQLYLRIAREESMFLICAAPFGTGFFVSWWFGEPIDWAKEIVLILPIIGYLLRKTIYTKTFYRIDVDDMFSEMVKHCVKEAIENMIEGKGIRKPLEREYQETRVTPVLAQ
ncbi:MAG: hypothetical protein H6551_02980 [Chitinophagales bacterium]|nr:hypothetical protein [Chitinophagaceae bacterium]MCB9064088.1 hypothetical protein [Chitinophagales bacterium]